MERENRTIRAVVIDDEQPARAIIREYLSAYSEIEIVSEAVTGTEGVEVIGRTSPDLVFLDIQMPGKSGFEVIELLPVRPAIIFCTAFDHYAISAFEVNAVDYLLKPFTRERFHEAILRVLQREVPRFSSDQLADLARTWREQVERKAVRFFVRSGSRIIPVDAETILWVEATGDYSRLHTATATYLCGERIGEMEKRLDPDKFMRVHRSAILAVDAVGYLMSDGDGGYTAHLKNGERVRVSRSYAAQLRGLLL